MFGKTQTFYVELGMILGVIVIMTSIPVAVILNRWLELPFARWSKLLTAKLLEMMKITRRFPLSRRSERR